MENPENEYITINDYINEILGDLIEKIRTDKGYHLLDVNDNKKIDIVYPDIGCYSERLFSRKEIIYILSDDIIEKAKMLISICGILNSLRYLDDNINVITKIKEYGEELKKFNNVLEKNLRESIQTKFHLWFNFNTEIDKQISNQLKNYDFYYNRKVNETIYGHRNFFLFVFYNYVNYISSRKNRIMERAKMICDGIVKIDDDNCAIKKYTFKKDSNTGDIVQDIIVNLSLDPN